MLRRPAAQAFEAGLHVVPGDPQDRVEPAHLVEHVAPHRDAGAGHDRHLPRVVRRRDLRRVLGTQQVLYRAHAGAGDAAAVLHAPVREQQLAADHADARLAGVRNQLAQPGRVVHRGVVVQEHQHVLRRGAGADVVDLGEVECLRVRQHGEPGPRRQLRQVVERCRLDRVVVDDDDLDLVAVVRRQADDAVDAGRQVVEAVAGGDDDRDAGPGIGDRRQVVRRPRRRVEHVEQRERNMLDPPVRRQLGNQPIEAAGRRLQQRSNLPPASAAPTATAAGNRRCSCSGPGTRGRIAA